MTELRFFPGSAQTIEIRLDASDTDGELALMELRLTPGDGAPPHRHSQEAETLLVREGELTVELDGDELRLGPGEAAFVRVGALHSFVSDTGAVVDVVATPAGLEEFFRAVCPDDPEAEPPSDEEFAEALERAGLDFSGD